MPLEDVKVRRAGRQHRPEREHTPTPPHPPPQRPGRRAAPGRSRRGGPGRARPRPASPSPPPAPSARRRPAAVASTPRPAPRPPPRRPLRPRVGDPGHPVRRATHARRPTPVERRAQASPTKQADREGRSRSPRRRRPASPRRPGSIPMPGAEITSCYGQRWGTLHAGIDFAAARRHPDPRRRRRHRGQGRLTSATGYGNSVFDRPRQRLPDPLRPPEPHRRQRGPAGQGRPGHRLRGLHRRLHRPAPALRGAPGQMWNQIDPAPFLRAHGVDVAC